MPCQQPHPRAMETTTPTHASMGLRISLYGPQSQSKPVLRIRDVFPDPGSQFFPSRIPDPNFFHPGSGSRIRIKEFKYFNPKKWFLSSRKYDPGCSFRIPDPDFSPIPDPGVTRHRIPDPQHWSKLLQGEPSWFQNELRFQRVKPPWL